MRRNQRNHALPEARRGTVLLVNPDAEILDEDRKRLESSSIEPLVCLGPEKKGGCPLLSGRPCPKLIQAEVVFLDLDLEVKAHRDLLALYREQPNLVVLESVC